MMSTSPNAQRAVVLLSGGLDSATTLAIAASHGFDCYALSFNYGQRHQAEIEAAQRVAAAQGVVEHRWVELDLRAIGGSALTADIDVPRDRPTAVMSHGVPITYVPARNTIFLSYALAWAEVLGSNDIFIGATAVDYSGYPDTRPEFIDAFEKMARTATKAGVEGAPITIHAPLIAESKKQIIRRGLELGVDYSLTHTCYDPDDHGRPCRRCDACLLRAEAFEALGMVDPLLA